MGPAGYSHLTVFPHATRCCPGVLDNPRVAIYNAYEHDGSRVGPIRGQYRSMREHFMRIRHVAFLALAVLVVAPAAAETLILGGNNNSNIRDALTSLGENYML